MSNKKVFIKTIIQIFLGSVATALFAQSADSIQQQKTELTAYIQTVYSSTNGLACGEANDVTQTPDGILWIGTYAGLYRYNGSDFRWVQDNNVRNVNCLHTDNMGRLWIGTNDNGLSVSLNERVINTIDASSGLPSNSVRCIVQGADNLYYIATSGGMVVLTLKDNELYTVASLGEVGYAVSLAADASGNIAAVSADGTLRLIHDKRIIATVKSNHEKEIYTSCAFDKNNTLYAGTSQNHVQRFSQNLAAGAITNQGEWECGSLANIKRLYFSDDKLFICADNGIGYLDTAGDYYSINTGDFNNSIDNMVQDYQGNYWFSSSRKGLLRLSTSSFVNMYKSLNMQNRVVNSVIEWQGLLYVGADNGMDAIDIQKNQQVFNALTHQFEKVRIRCLATSSNGSLWICTYGKGLFEVTESGNIITYDSASTASGRAIGDRVRVALETDEGIIAVAHNKGISFIQNHRVFSELTSHDGLGSSMVLSLMNADDGSLFAGTNGDGIIVIKDYQIQHKYTTVDGLTSGVILRTVPDGRGGVFIVTSNSLCQLSPANGGNYIRELKNFPYYNNYDIISDTPDSSGSLFVLGSAGIYVVPASDMHTYGEISYELLDAKSGLNNSLTANAWNWHDSRGNLYLASETGVYKVNMFGYREKQKSCRMHIITIKLDNEPYQLEDYKPVCIERSVKKIEIIPEVINYTTVDPYVSYKLEGFDSKWTRTPKSELQTIVYTNLQPGNYTLRIALQDGKQGNTIEESKCILLKQKAFYDNKSFKVCAVLAIIALIVLITFTVVRLLMYRTIVHQRKELERAKEQARMGNQTVFAIAKTVDAKDENTSQHSSRVAEYSVLIAREMGFTDDECENLRKAALLHDIGKIGIPDRILNKPGKLTTEEYDLMKSHVTRGAEILKDFTMIEHLSDGVLYHHERYDGKGYVQGLKGKEIPLYGRIIGVADAFDAMTANRVYRKRLDFKTVLEELLRCRGTQFDPDIADILLSLIKNGTINTEKLYS